MPKNPCGSTFQFSFSLFPLLRFVSGLLRTCPFRLLKDTRASWQHAHKTIKSCAVSLHVPSNSPSAFSSSLLCLCTPSHLPTHPNKCCKDTRARAARPQNPLSKPTSTGAVLANTYLPVLLLLFPLLCFGLRAPRLPLTRLCLHRRPVVALALLALFLAAALLLLIPRIGRRYCMVCSV